MNKVILIGNLTRDPEVRYTQTGKAVATFSIAVNRFSSQNSNTGERNTSVDFIPIVAWEKLAENCGNYLTKGRRILVEGRLQIRDYETNSGEKRRIAEIIAQNIEFLGGKNTSQNSTNDNDLVVDTAFKGSTAVPQQEDEEIPF